MGTRLDLNKTEITQFIDIVSQFRVVCLQRESSSQREAGRTRTGQELVVGDASAAVAAGVPSGTIARATSPVAAVVASCTVVVVEDRVPCIDPAVVEASRTVAAGVALVASAA